MVVASTLASAILSNCEKLKSQQALNTSTGAPQSEALEEHHPHSTRKQNQGEKENYTSEKNNCTIALTPDSLHVEYCYLMVNYKMLGFF